MTPRTIISQALRTIRITASEETPTAAELNDGLDTFNQMVNGFESQAINLGFSDLTLDEDLPLDKKFHEGVRFLLAVVLAPEYGVEITPEIAIKAQSGMAFLQSHFAEIPILKMDKGLRNRRSRWGGDSAT